jgi:hypothetical protein
MQPGVGGGEPVNLIAKIVIDGAAEACTMCACPARHTHNLNKTLAPTPLAGLSAGVFSSVGSISNGLALYPKAQVKKRTDYGSRITKRCAIQLLLSTPN